MNALQWVANCFSQRSKAISHYRRGMGKAKKHNHQGAIEDYTVSLGIRDTPPDVLAMVLYNRALAYVAAGEARKGADDLEAVLGMKETLINVKTMARQKLARMESRSVKSNGSTTGSTSGQRSQGRGACSS